MNNSQGRKQAMRRVPVRMCIVCRKLVPRTDMIRMVKNEERGILWDEEYSLSGKGVYICRKRECIAEFIEGRKFRKNFGKLLNSVCLDKLKEVKG